MGRGFSEGEQAIHAIALKKAESGWDKHGDRPERGGSWAPFRPAQIREVIATSKGLLAKARFFRKPFGIQGRRRPRKYQPTISTPLAKTQLPITRMAIRAQTLPSDRTKAAPGAIKTDSMIVIPGRPRIPAAAPAAEALRKPCPRPMTTARTDTARPGMRRSAATNPLIWSYQRRPCYVARSVGSLFINSGKKPIPSEWSATTK
ncbi:MAG: hypothetical protein V2I40_01450 [Desulfobacteraceae bacterium]|jgi:hypothetical protein|nr:hypothetical protein [Desulfobacteraceae bacterium]